MNKDFVLLTGKNNQLRITAFGIENIKNAFCIIFVHGFKGFKDWGFGPYCGRFFADKSYFVLTFNFSHNGIGENSTEFTELNKFAENTISLEISELSELIDAYLNGYFGKTENNKIGLIGHSRGGGVSILTARNKNSINSAALWSSVTDFDRYTNRQKEEWKKRGYIEILNTRTKQKMKINKSFLEDIERNKEDILNIKKSVSEFNRPLLMIHGEQDLTIPVKEVYQLYEVSDKSKTEIFSIPHTGHTFDVQHPFNGSNPKFDLVLNKTFDFFQKNLN